MLMHYSLSLIAIRLKKCVIKLLILMLLQCNLFLIAVRLNQCLINKVVSEEPFILKHCIDRHKTQETHDKAVDALLLALKFVPGYFVTNEVLEKLDNVVFSNDDIFFVDVDSDVVTFFNDDMGRNTINFNNINFVDDNFELYPETIIHVRRMTWYNKYKQHKARKEVKN